jgi:YD repeat-containing protein
MSRPSVKWAALVTSTLVAFVCFSLLSVSARYYAWVKISVAHAGQASFPDLVVSSITNPPSTAHAGSSFSVTDTTGNSGDNTASASTTQYRLSVDATITSSDTLIGTRSIGTLKKGSSSSGGVTVTIPSNLTLGTYYLGACADGTGAITESNETNNCRASTTTVNVIAPINFTANPSVVPAGGTSTATWSQINNPSVNDWIGLYPVGSGSYVTWAYLNCSQFKPPSTPIASGSCVFGISSSLTPGNYEFRLLSNGVWVATSNTIVVNPPEPVSKLAITQLTSVPPTAGSEFSARVESHSVSGIPTNVSTDTAVSISLKTGTGTGILSGTFTGTIAAGTKHIYVGPLTYTKAESGVVLTATRTSGDSLSPGDSAPITFSAGPATTMSFVTQPANSQAGATIAGPPTVAFKDAFGNIATSSTASITTEINSPSYGVLYGMKTKNASSGVATFGDLTINQVGAYILKASSSGFSVITSTTFNITTPLGTVNGTVSRATGGTPIDGALVEALQAGIVQGSAVSGVNGTYSIANLATGIYEIRASAAGFLAQSQSGIGVTLGSTSAANFSLSQERIVYVYDPLSRLRAVIDVSGQTATYAYDAVGNLLGISRYNSSQASVVEFTPGSGLVGTSVKIFGTGFSATPSQNTVTFSGTPATVLSAAPTQLVAMVPSGATTGPIGVSAPSGAASSANSFIVTSSSTNGVPTVSGFTPTVGTPGTAVTVNGTNFDGTPSKNDLRFNISRGAISSSNSTSISTTVPSGTGSGRISVTTALGKGTSNADFFVPPSPLTATDIEFTGRLAEATPLNVVLNNSGKKGLLVFDGTAGQRVSLSVSNSTYPFPCPWCSNVGLTFYRPNGSLWVTTSWANTSVHYFEPPILPASGTYTILFDPGAGTGQALVSLSHVTGEDQGTITPGVPISVSVSIPGQNPQWVFNGTAGQRISLNVTAANLPMACPWCQAAYVSIYKPDGQVFVQGTWANASGTFIDVQTLPVSGTYTLLLDPQGGSTGRATIGLYNIPPDDQGPITADGTPVLANITIPGQKILRSFVGTQNQVVSLQALNSAFGCGTGTIAILRPDNTILSSINYCNNKQFLEPVTLPENGIYRVLVDGAGAFVGQATLRLHTVVDVTGTITPDGTPVTVNITTPGQKVLLTFTGTANQVLTLEAPNTTFDCPFFDTGAYMYILKPDNSVLGSQGVCGVQSMAPVALPVNGTYTVMLDALGESLGQVTWKLVPWPPLTLTYNGKIRDRVGQGDAYLVPAALGPDGVMDGTFTVTLPSGSGQRTVTSLELRNSVNGVWDTLIFGFWVLGAASNFDTALYNNADGTVNFTVSDGGSFKVFGSDFNNTHFNSGTIFLMKVFFSDGTKAGGGVVVP